MYKKIVFTLVLLLLNTTPIFAGPKMQYQDFTTSVIDDNNELYLIGQYNDEDHAQFTKADEDVLSAVESVQYNDRKMFTVFYIIKTDNSLYVSSIDGGEKKIADNVVSVTAGTRDNVFFIKEDRSLWGMGNNIYGVLGDGSDIPKTEPVKIMDNIKNVYVGYRIMFALTEQGELYVWGENSDHKITSNNDSKFVKPVMLMDNVVDFEPNYEDGTGPYYLALDTEDKLWIWGLDDGKVGYDLYFSFDKPPMIISENVMDFNGSNKDYLILILKKDKTLWAMGEELCNWRDDIQNPSIPIEIEKDVKEIALFNTFFLILKDNGELARYYKLYDDKYHVDKYIIDEPKNNVAHIILPDKTFLAYSAYVLCNDHTVWGMGLNLHGRLGVGLDDYMIYEPKECEFLSNIYSETSVDTINVNSIPESPVKNHLTNWYSFVLYPAIICVLIVFCIKLLKH